MCGHGNENTRNDAKPFVDMDFNLFCEIITDMKNWEGAKLKLLRLAGLGEPMLHKQLPDMIKFVKDANITERVDMFSNGSLLTSDMANALIDSGLDAIRFSIYAADKENHVRVTSQSRTSPEDILNNIRFLRKLRDEGGGGHPYIFVKMFDAYGPENDLFRSMYQDVADEFDIEKVHNATSYNENDLIGAFYGEGTQKAETESAYNNVTSDAKSCPRPFMALCIDSLGNVLMCTHDWPRYTKIANLNNQTIRDVWNGDELFEFRKMQLEGRLHENKLCKNCTWFKLFPKEDNVDGFPFEKLPRGC